MSWTTPSDLKGQLIKLWERGELLRDMVDACSRFPLRLVLHPPNSIDITEHFEDVRNWASALANLPWCDIEYRDLNHRIQGTQRLPAQISVRSIEDAIDCLGRHDEWTQFQQLLEMTRNEHPLLIPWLRKRPLQALALSREWRQLLAVVTWLNEHPQPAIYLRQMDIPSVHSKFVENHRATLSELLDLTLPDHAVKREKTGVQQFAARYGFLEKPGRIRFRLLDPDIEMAPGLTLADITLDTLSFSRLRLPIRGIFITENETNFLAFPQHAKSLVIFGSGYGWDGLAKASWLGSCQIYYWGDIDTHGFAILNQLRHHFSQVQSFLMDRGTLDQHRTFWGSEQTPFHGDLSQLTAPEQELYQAMCSGGIQPNLRLEQEHIGFGWLLKHLHHLPPLDRGLVTTASNVSDNSPSD